MLTGNDGNMMSFAKSSKTLCDNSLVSEVQRVFVKESSEEIRRDKWEKVENKRRIRRFNKIPRLWLLKAIF